MPDTIGLLLCYYLYGWLNGSLCSTINIWRKDRNQRSRGGGFNRFSFTYFWPHNAFQKKKKKKLHMKELPLSSNRSEQALIQQTNTLYLHYIAVQFQFPFSSAWKTSARQFPSVCRPSAASRSSRLARSLKDKQKVSSVFEQTTQRRAKTSLPTTNYILAERIHKYSINVDDLAFLSTPTRCFDSFWSESWRLAGRLTIITSFWSQLRCEGGEPDLLCRWVGGKKNRRFKSSGSQRAWCPCRTRSEDPRCYKDESERKKNKVIVKTKAVTAKRLLNTRRAGLR